MKILIQPKRILNSLTSIDEIYLKKFEIFTDPNRVKKLNDQKWLKNYRENPNERVITIGYISLVNIQMNLSQKLHHLHKMLFGFRKRYS